MAEVLGAVASTVALFKVCIEASGLIQTARHQDADLQKLTLKLNIEKCRLYTWGEAMGLTAVRNSRQQCPLAFSPFQDLVCDTLQAILNTFQDTHKMKEMYGCREAPTANGRKRPIESGTSKNVTEYLAAAFLDFKIAEATRDKAKSITLTTRWVIHDQKKFSGLVAESKTLIDGLQEITKSLSPVARQAGMMTYNIQQVKDADTLQLIADTSQQDYPDHSDAASIKLDIMTIATNERLAVESWIDDIDPSVDTENSDIESMTIAELQHRLRPTSIGIRYPNTRETSSAYMTDLESKEIMQEMELFDHNAKALRNEIEIMYRLYPSKFQKDLKSISLGFLHSILTLQRAFLKHQERSSPNVSRFKAAENARLRDEILAPTSAITKSLFS